MEIPSNSCSVRGHIKKLNREFLLSVNKRRTLNWSIIYAQVYVYMYTYINLCITTSDTIVTVCTQV
jgi:hypothetical protein